MRRPLDRASEASEIWNRTNPRSWTTGRWMGIDGGGGVGGDADGAAVCVIGSGFDYPYDVLRVGHVARSPYFFYHHRHRLRLRVHDLEMEDRGPEIPVELSRRPASFVRHLHQAG